MGHHQAVEVITKSMNIRLPDGIPFGTVYIRKTEHTETNILIICSIKGRTEPETSNINYSEQERTCI
jgi:hypothetical protein